MGSVLPSLSGVAGKRLAEGLNLDYAEKSAISFFQFSLSAQLQ